MTNRLLKLAAAAVASMVVCTSCRRASFRAVDAGPRQTPSIAVGTLAADSTVPPAAIGETTITNEFGMSMSVEVAAQVASKCITGIRMKTLDAGDCDVTVGPPPPIGETGEALIGIPFSFACARERSSWSYGGSVLVRCDPKLSPPSPVVDSLGPRIVVKEVRPAAAKSAGLALSPADRATLEAPVSFPRKSAKPSDAMAVLVSDKAKIVHATPGFDLWVTGLADENKDAMANLALSERRSQVVIDLLNRPYGGTDKNRFNRFSLGDMSDRGSGVVFEVKER